MNFPNSLQKLVLYTRNNSILSKSSMEELFGNCTHLRVFKNVGIKNQDLNIEDLKDEIRENYPLINADIIATRWYSLPVSEYGNPE